MKKDQKFQLRHDSAWMEAINEWRLKEIVKRKADLSRSQAIRELVDKGLEK